MRHPEWFKITLPKDKTYYSVKTLLKEYDLPTVCMEAKCPNCVDCFSHRRLTFLILGKVCTRNCAYCGINKGIPVKPDIEEPVKISGLVNILKLDHIVITSVTRDDLRDEGAGQFAATVNAIKEIKSDCRIEVLTPDFSGRIELLHKVLNAKPDIFTHNLELVEQLFVRFRPKGQYSVSLGLLEQAKNMNARTKSGIMVGLGETDDQIYSAFEDLKKAGVDILTVGQYLPPVKGAPEVKKYYTPSEFDTLKKKAKEFGFQYVFSGPKIRSSYCSGEEWV